MNSSSSRVATRWMPGAVASFFEGVTSLLCDLGILHVVLHDYRAHDIVHERHADRKRYRCQLDHYRHRIAPAVGRGQDADVIVARLLPPKLLSGPCFVIEHPPRSESALQPVSARLGVAHDVEQSFGRDR